MQRGIRIESNGRHKDFRDSIAYYDKQLPINYNNIHYIVEYIVCKTHYVARKFAVNFRQGVCYVTGIRIVTNDNKKSGTIRINKKIYPVDVRPIKAFLSSLANGDTIVLTKSIAIDKYTKEVVDIYRSTSYDSIFPSKLKTAAIHLECMVPTKINEANYIDKARDILSSVGMVFDLAHVYITLIKLPPIKLTELSTNLIAMNNAQAAWDIYYSLYIFTQKINYTLKKINTA